MINERRLALLILAAILAACGPRTAAVRVTAGLLERGAPALREEPDPDLAREALPGQLKLLEALLRNDPANPELLVTLAEAAVGYAYLFLEDEAPERARGLYRRAADWGLRLAEAGGRLKGPASLSPEAMGRALSEAEREDAPALYWTAMAWAGAANLAQSDPEALATVPKAERMMGRALALAPEFQFGGPDLFFGVLYSARPKIAGGDPERGRRHFEAAVARTQGRYLPAKLLYAQHYAVATLDEDLFRSLLGEIAAADPAALPEARLANEVAKRKAKRLMERIDELF